MSTLIEPEIAARHWEQAALDQMAKDLEAQGFDVRREEPVGDLRADLVARRGDDVRVFEFKAMGRPSDTAAVAALRRQAIDRLGATFHLVLVSPPRQKSISIAGIEGSLTAALAGHPDLRAVLPPDASIHPVADVELDRIEVGPRGTLVHGSATVGISWEVDDEILDDLYPISFEVLLDTVGQVLSLEELQIELGEEGTPEGWRAGPCRFEGSRAVFRRHAAADH